ncbi:MAG: hypothetical protein IT365_02685 [Candidatus Hydrogenedentes bacterium]|nr:hypothetical protein [Candidatus Hydrogenedentota bacterium]
MVRLCSWLLALAVVISLTAHAQHVKVEKATVSMASVKKMVKADLFPTNFLLGDSNYHSMVSASDGNIYFSVDTHNIDYACRFYRFDPRTETMSMVAQMDQVLGEDAATHVAQGKIHTPFFEHAGKLWFATHTAFYAGDLPGFDSGDRVPYQGGHFMNYDLATRQFEDLAHVFPSEGIITMAMDTRNEVLYGLTWPSGMLISYDIKKKALRYWGAVQGRGELGQHPHEWDRICRTLGIDPEGNVYGSTMDGRIWKYDPKQERRVSYIDGLDLSRLPFSQSAEETLKGDFQYNWRVVEWNERTQSFWGIQWETTTLFEFAPATNYVRAVAELRHEAYQGMPRNPEISQLGFILAPNNTIYYLGNGPAVAIEGRPEAQSNVYLFTYALDTGRMINHGPVFSRDGRRVFFTESLCIGADDHLYTVAWVEATDPERIKTISEARSFGPVETARMLYEIMIVRLPKWQTFAKD